MAKRKPTPPHYNNVFQKKIIALTERWMRYAAQQPHRSLRLTKRQARTLGGRRLPKVWQHCKDTFRLLRGEWWLMVKLAVIYAAISYVIVGGLSQIDFVTLKQATQQAVGGNMAALYNAGSLFAAAASGALNGAASELQQFMGGLITFITWLAVVWALRRRLADKPIKVTVRDALYNCCAPLVPASLILLVMLFQLIPAALGVFIFAIAQSAGQMQSGVQIMLFVFASGLLCLLSAYWLSSSLLSLVAVTTPGMYPWRALYAANRLVTGQRGRLLMRVAVLGVIIVAAWAVVLVPVLLIDSWVNAAWLPLVPIVVQILSAASAVFTPLYIYKTYRDLL